MSTEIVEAEIRRIAKGHPVLTKQDPTTEEIMDFIKEINDGISKVAPTSDTYVNRDNRGTKREREVMLSDARDLFIVFILMWVRRCNLQPKFSDNDRWRLATTKKPVEPLEDEDESAVAEMNKLFPPLFDTTISDFCDEFDEDDNVVPDQLCDVFTWGDETRGHEYPFECFFTPEVWEELQRKFAEFSE